MAAELRVVNLGNCVTMFASVNTSLVYWEGSLKAEALIDVTFIRTGSRRCAHNWISSLIDGLTRELLAGRSCCE